MLDRLRLRGHSSFFILASPAEAPTVLSRLSRGLLARAAAASRAHELLFSRALLFASSPASPRPDAITLAEPLLADLDAFVAAMDEISGGSFLRCADAEVDLAALGRPLQALVAIRLSVHSRDQIESFTEHVRTLAGVLSIFHVTGQTDYLLWVAAADAHDLREFVVEHLASDPAVSHAETSLIYEQRRGPGVFGADPA
jgi:hypothetical protein